MVVCFPSTPKRLAMTIGCFISAAALFAFGAHISYVNVAPQQARTKARNEFDHFFVHESWKAHEKAAKECAEKGECARKAIVVCGVIAGRIAHYHAHGLMDEEDGEFDSAMEWGGAI
ncbi:PREDICTED: transmembrane [Prunus dulcis]|uniref:PREDICTED: transmembrane n=1 Tax=Prunus dulcis TaxID=3755 RepID=A0A5E4GG14_PRUDU|nr:PREDICTED: transmembrane [Prunus dulcis]